MKHRTFLRRSLPLVALLTLILTFALPTSAFVFSREDIEPSVASFSKNGLATASISFSADDFVVEGGVTLDSIVIASLPDANAGILTLAGQELAVGDVVAINAVSGLRFQPLSTPTVASAHFSFTPIFANGTTGSDVNVGVYLLASENNAPIAENLELSTYKNVAITAQFAATDPEGDILTFQLVKKPARGAVTMPVDGSSEFVYTPYENKTGKDSFTYVAVDAVGNTSGLATVQIKIEKPSTKVTYADMDGVSAYKAAIRLAEEGVFVGECMGGQYFFNPDTPVSRSEFVAMSMKVTGIDALDGVTTTGFADDIAIPTWAKPYAASALKSGVVQGTADENGRIVFNPSASITRAEAAVLLDRALKISDVSEAMFSDSETAPVWAVQSAANLQTCGIIRTDGTGTLGLSHQLTRADAAEMLLGAMEVLDQRNSGGWFHF